MLRRHFALPFVLLLAGCHGVGLPPLGILPTQLDDSVLHEEVFDAAYKRLDTFALEPVQLGQLVPQGMKSLHDLDPTFTAPPPAPGVDWAAYTYQSIMASPALAKLPPEEVYSAYFAGLLSPLDGFSHYISPLDVAHDSEWKDGYGGIGVTFERRGRSFQIVDIFNDSPAAKAGLKSGQSVLAIDGVPTGQLSSEAFSEKVRGPIGTTLVLRVSTTAGDAQDVTITRDKVIPHTVSLKMQGDIAILRIARFTPGTVEEFSALARQAVWSHARAVILDLQHNPGGRLESGTAVADLLLQAGPIATTEGRHPEAHLVFTATDGDVLDGLPLYVLVDGRSASAAEVLAAALQERGRAKLIGSATYGKGSVQNVAPLPNGAELAVTWAHILSPQGHSWVKTGLQPDICVVGAAPCPREENIEEKALSRALALIQGVP